MQVVELVTCIGASALEIMLLLLTLAVALSVEVPACEIIYSCYCSYTGSKWQEAIISKWFSSGKL